MVGETPPNRNDKDRKQINFIVSIYICICICIYKFDTPHLQKLRADFFGGFFGDFVKSTCEGACLTSAALAATTGEAPQNLCHFLSLSLFLSLALTATLSRARHVAKEFATYPNANVQLQQRRDIKHHLLHPFS